MRRYTRNLSVSVLLSVAALAACVVAGAQKKTRPDAKASQAESAPQKEDATLAETLAWLNDNLTRYGKFTLYQPLSEPGFRVRLRFVGLEAEGCSVTYRVKHEQLGSGGTVRAPLTDVERRTINVVNGPNGRAIRSPDSTDNVYRPDAWKPSADGSDVDERTLDLAALDPSLVRGETPKKWDGGVVTFGAGRGKVAVRYTGRKGKLLGSDGDRFYVSEKERVEQIADALRRAVALCRK